MLRTSFIIIVGLLSLAGLVFLLPTPAPEMPRAQGLLAITQVQVLTPQGVSAPQTVLIQSGRIAALGQDLDIPDGAERLDGRGLTALPGLIDAHTHTWGAGLAATLKFGVTTHLDMFSAPSMLGATRSAREDLTPRDEADLFSAGMLATVEGGHGTQFGIPIETLSRPDEAEAWVQRRLEEGSDFIKLVYIPDAPTLPSLDLATARAVIEASHARNAIVVAHVSSLEGARAMVEAGIDGLVHIFADATADDAFIAAAREAEIFVIPTLAVIASVAGTGAGAELADDPRVAPYLAPGARSTLQGGFGVPQSRAFQYPLAMANVRALYEAGIPILAGSDAPNPGTAYGASLHHEMALLRDAGLSGLDALRAATHLPAQIFALEERGRIEPGARADLVLVRGNPVADTTASLEIVHIFRNGTEVERDGGAGGAAAGMALASPDLTPFDVATNGFAWVETTDAMAGGNSQAQIEIVDGRLITNVSVRAGFVFPWAGPSYFPASPRYDPLDLSATPILVVRASGTPGPYRVMLFMPDLMGIPPTVPITLGEDDQTIRLDLSDVEGFDHTRFGGLALVAGPALGEGVIELGEARFEAAP